MPNNMKTTTSLSLLLSLVFGINSVFACMQVIDFEPDDEEYVDDTFFKEHAVFSTDQVFADTIETSIINTHGYYVMNQMNIQKQAKYAKFDMKDEEYIDDIPFDTEEIFNSMVNFDAGDKNVVVKDFYLAEEQYIDDIPFDTKKLILERLRYPEFARKPGIEGVVSVCCRYDEKGFLKVIDCNCSDELLRDYIVALLQNIRLREGIVSLDHDYILKFNFKSI